MQRTGLSVSRFFSGFLFTYIMVLAIFYLILRDFAGVKMNQLFSRKIDNFSENCIFSGFLLFSLSFGEFMGFFKIKIYSVKIDLNLS